ncbi:IS4 family transposase [bacterium]|nr:IS4 family transposase [bacterium]
MSRVCSIFSQLLECFPRLEFEAAVREHKGERHARGFNCWTQFVAMLFCQLGRAQSLSEITGGLASCEGKLRHLGVQNPPRKSTLAYANAHRPWPLYQAVFERFFQRASTEALQRGRKKFRFKHKLLSLDATMIPVSLNVFDWAVYQKTKGAVKLHMVLDHDGYLPRFAVITDGKTSEITVARQQQYEPGTMLVFDKGYTNHRWFLKLSRQRVHFVTRLKDDASYGLIVKPDNPRFVDQSKGIVRDEDVVLTSIQEEGPQAIMRRVEVWVEDKDECMVFLTNNRKLAATTIAEIYRDRWQIEQFFKSLKQSLRIKTFVGTTANAVAIQIWTALIAMLLVKYLQLRASFGWSLSNLVAMLRLQLFVYRDLQAWLDEPFKPPPDLRVAAQMTLELD